MTYLKQVLVMVLMAAVLSLTPPGSMRAFGQKNDNRPPKQPEKVRQPDKQPRGNNNTNNNNRRGKP